MKRKSGALQKVKLKQNFTSKGEKQRESDLITCKICNTKSRFFFFPYIIMGGDEISQMGLNCPSLGMNSGNNFKNPHEGGDCFYGSGWDPIASMSLNSNFGAFPDRNAVELAPKLPDFGSGNLSGLVNSFGVPSRGQNYTSICPERYCQVSDDSASPNGKRKRISDQSSPSNPNKTAELDAQQDLSGDTSEQKGSDEKKQKTENSQGEETGKGNYVHMRARRGQATNSHSLAERVRREKISERMRALQEIVPGCSKITGKAVMLDEIINYVQSLQQQVEFLSMKLATVNPESSFDINRILPKDIQPLLGFNPGTSSSHPYAPGIHQGAIQNISNGSTYLSLPQGTWDGDMQGLFNMGFNTNPGLANLGPNGAGSAGMVQV
ncbi:hypothetical protein V2J09_023859 [Rumex salicifolius]